MTKALCWILDEEDLTRQGRYVWDYGGNIDFSHIARPRNSPTDLFRKCSLVLLKKKNGEVVTLKNRFK